MGYEVIRKSVPVVTKTGKRSKWSDLVEAVRQLPDNDDECVSIPFTGSTSAMNTLRGNLTKIFNQAGIQVVHLYEDGRIFIWNRNSHKRLRTPTGWKLSATTRAKIGDSQRKRWERVRQSNKTKAATAGV